MLHYADDLERRRPVWEALSTLFLDSELTVGRCRYIARVCVESGYTRTEVERILWAEVTPVIAHNLGSITGEWAGFDLHELEQDILRSTEKFDVAATENRWHAKVITEAWQDVLKQASAEWSNPTTKSG
jgi:hypothetical protein